ncbi:LemA family protein [Candidatus Saccharibacteria bacterium]|nr:LemA family protein [Candidatus Saccharibacteria bacterium]
MVIALIIVGLILLTIIVIYNTLVRAKVRTDEAWSDITVQLKRRYDLIPNLVEAVKGYAKHESSVFQKVTEARTRAMSAEGPAEAAKADNMFQAALKSLFAVAEAYPQLRASENFQKLQDEVTDTEDKIQASRRFYNGAARDLNIKIQTFPTNLFAGMMGFKIREFFEVPGGQAAAVAEPVKVDFSNSNKQ